jgi:hypothetical protein
VTANRSDGRTAVSSIPVTSTAITPFVVHAEPQDGVGPLTVRFTLENRSGATISNVNWDFKSISVINTTASPSTPVSFTYTTPGLYLCTARFYNSSGLPDSQSIRLLVLDATQVDTAFQAMWSGMNTALAAGDKAKALTYLNEQARAKYDPVFTDLLPEMPAIVASYSPLQRVSVSSEIAEFAVNRVIDGVNRVFLIYYVRDGDGVWRLDSM